MGKLEVASRLLASQARGLTSYPTIPIESERLERSMSHGLGGLSSACLPIPPTLVLIRKTRLELVRGFPHTCLRRVCLPFHHSRIRKERLELSQGCPYALLRRTCLPFHHLRLDEQVQGALAPCFRCVKRASQGIYDRTVLYVDGLAIAPRIYSPIILLSNYINHLLFLPSRYQSIVLFIHSSILFFGFQPNLSSFSPERA